MTPDGVEVAMPDSIDALPPSSAPIDKGLRVAIAITLPVLLFCGIYAALQARFVARDTAALRDEVEALHTQVSKLQRPGVAPLGAVPSPRPTAPRKAKAAKRAAKKAAKAEGAGGEAPAKKGKRKGGKAKAATGEGAPEAREAKPRPRKKAGPKRRRREGPKRPPEDPGEPAP